MQTVLDTVDKIASDLARSGLVISDIRARELDVLERTTCNVPQEIKGYIIPYFDITGRPIPYYRSRLFDYHIKYKQVKNTPNHVYFPPNFLPTFNALPKDKKLIVIVEGEKKAALGVKIGLPTVAFGGVDSWKNKTLTLPGDAEIAANSIASSGTTKRVLSIRVPDNGYDQEMLNVSPYAIGFQDMIDLGMAHRATIVIVYDSDKGIGMKPEVQRAAATLGYELRYQGFKINQIKQIVLPQLPELDKTALDDFIMAPERTDPEGNYTIDSGGINRFRKLLESTLLKKKAFPRNPNVREYVNKKLQRMKLMRKEMQSLSLAVVTELDARGQRMYSESAGDHYYFDASSSKLMKAPINVLSRESLQETTFGKLLYNDFGIVPSADARLMQWLGSQFTAEDPIESVTPHRVLARVNFEQDNVHLQINDSQFITVDKDGIDVHDNGSDGILFESGCIQPLEAADLITEFDRLEKLYGTDKPVPNYWSTVLKEARLKDHGKQSQLFALLYHISPFLFRWRGTQLPVELVFGESGSGKSTLMELRLDILTGHATLRNAPTDLKDWHASISNTGGLHVTDNVQLLDRSLSQRLSDEICRLITEPHPHIEMRKYYTNADLMQVDVSAVFAFTAIKQPFSNADLLQRSVLLEFDKAPTAQAAGQITYDSRWRSRQVERYGGRSGWFAYHLFVLHRFFIAVSKEWNQTYGASQRLINLEQALCLLSKSVFGQDPSWIPGYLVAETNSSITDADWAFEGINAFTDEVRANVAKGLTPKERKFSASEISNWAMGQEDFAECVQLTNPRKLGRYLQTHKHMAASIAGLSEAGTYANRVVYTVSMTKAPTKSS
jgi:hypothetical protein